jgi:hypothetical protein
MHNAAGGHPVWEADGKFPQTPAAAAALSVAAFNRGGTRRRPSKLPVGIHTNIFGTLRRIPLSKCPLWAVADTVQRGTYTFAASFWQLAVWAEHRPVVDGEDVAHRRGDRLFGDHPECKAS